MQSFIFISLEALIFILALSLFFLDRQNRTLTRKLDVSHEWQSKRITAVAREVDSLKGKIGDLSLLKDSIEAVNAQVYLLGEELDKLSYEKYEELDMTQEEQLKAKRAEKLFTEGISSILGYDFNRGRNRQ